MATLAEDGSKEKNCDKCTMKVHEEIYDMKVLIAYYQAIQKH